MSNQQIALEDHFEDVIGKACRGLGIDDPTLSFLTGVDEEKIASLKEGEFDETTARAISSTLGLHPDSLVALAKKAWHPEDIGIPGLKLFGSWYDDMWVNAYLAWDETTKEAAIFDSGADATEMLAFIKDQDLKVTTVFLTHTHRDHVMQVPQILGATGNPPVYVGVRESHEGAEGFEAGRSFQVGGLTIDTRSTTGHSVGGISYIIGGLARSVAIVGDALFSSSMGGGVVSFTGALEANRQQLFTLPDETVVCPGHGPMTTIGEEKAHNPFYPEYK